MALQVYNTMTRRKEPFETIEPGVVRMYVCGVTVYDDSHIGHALMAITFDMIRRYLEWSGYTVKHAQNFTDVDDKIINRAAQYGVEPLEFAERYIDAWFEESQELNVLPATVYPRASQEITGMLEMIGSLIEDGYAYQSESGDVNYDVTRFAEYGKLSHRNLDDLLAGARVAVDPTKHHPMDFVLWKAAKPGEPAWDSPWGPGRPGWHIECSVMAAHHLGGRLDIHGGGADLIFPHHENEIAQSEAFEESRPFARYWVHNALLEFSGEKMSKSIGNLVTTREIIENGDAGPFRLMVLQTHYRHPLTFTDEGMVAARRGYERLLNAVRDIEALQSDASEEISDQLADAEGRFREAMGDDFNAPVAVSVLFDLARLANQSSGPDRAAAQAKLLELGDVLGLPLARDAAAEGAGDAAPFIELLLELRQQLRQEKQYAMADSIRGRLAALGVTVEDSASGSTWRWSG
ncbi:MAG TPA: cysteine--tRNA ligase [Woeseiaceae bacterium]|nr:cysteine--tRNA ligase [Woeseiaceae bacterium]